MLKKCNFRGISIGKIKKISYQTLKCLSFLVENNIIHCDLKPENILLLSPTSTSVKVIDFGSSCFLNHRMYTYIQSRFYRAPEIVLGIPYTPAIDIWSFGCILVELYTGLPIFPAENEKDLISCVTEVIGEPSTMFLSTGQRSSVYFTPDGKLKPYKSSRGRRRFPNTRPLKSILKGADEGFIRLISACIRWDPNERINPENALKSFWFMENLAVPKVQTRYCKISMEDIIKHTPRLKKFVVHQSKPTVA